MSHAFLITLCDRVDEFLAFQGGKYIADLDKIGSYANAPPAPLKAAL